MKKICLALSLAICFSPALAENNSSFLIPHSSFERVDAVNTLMGTQSSFELSAGNTYPVIAMPWGMNFWTPQTGRMGDGWQYTYDAPRIRGFKQTHQPSPWINDYGQFSIMPVSGTPVFDEEARASWFSHKAETAKPYYYSVYLADYDIVAEMAPTERACAMRFSVPEEGLSVVIDAFDRGSEVEVIPERRMILGKTTRNSGGVPDNFANYFVVQFDSPISLEATYLKSAECDSLLRQPESLTAAGFHAGAIVDVDARKGERVVARVASSFISPEQALRNLQEVGERSFDEIAADGRARWNDILGRIAIEDDDVDRVRTFYSCLYRSTLFPRKFYEFGKDGEVMHYSPYSGETLPGYMYTDTGVWDTFRSLFPLLNLMYPSESLKMQEGFLNAYRESGYFPEWCSPGHRDCMVGNNSASVLADAWLKGIRVSDPETLWEGIINGTKSTHPTVKSTGRVGYDYYNRLGYVPYNVGINESAARTLEYAYDDWCILQLGRSLGKSEKELKPFAKRALNYRNLFDPETHLMRGRNEDGTFATPFSPLKWGDAFTEGNAWHYTWSVFHDPQGLIDLMGGRESFTAMLDSVFNVAPKFDDSYYGFPIHEIREMTVMNMGNYAHGNQPIQHMIYLYNWAGQPWKTQYWVRQVLDRMYSPTPDGYCGDEDNGQTSAWYVFSTLGFYPVCPASDQYALGAPAVRRALLTFESGAQTEISSNTGWTLQGASANSAHCAEASAEENIYIDSLEVNGAPYDLNYLTHSQLTSGSRIDFRLSPTPNLTRGVSPSSVPSSFSHR